MLFHALPILALVAITAAAPPCTTTSSYPASSSTPVTDDCSTRTVCVDYINDCGLWYGGCFADCAPWPTFTAPPCTGTSSVPSGPVTTPAISTQQTTLPCSSTLCVDYLKTCGTTAVLTYGG
ncbi:uncharacterized protein BCR38DRAFT_418936 [Pseudomassariella vexata]|uniref:Uncharacterized protein n=1 Tax=Pseudomassariella vexata TaxID=1141098 RepID=A0A1Y2EKN5_9PEZI|nr:uncharacterized protein BCR38DRAFT_418936 [Pseudomassariella vexata]ORY72110.1 hypothetical protein BCR38DRAFT_418936 [Pseudomassariella vexata]